MMSRRGFTLIELVIVIAIIGILIGSLYPNLVKYHDRYREQERANNEYVVNKALKQYYAFTGDYPDCPAVGVDTALSPYLLKDGTVGEGIQWLDSELRSKTGVNIDTARFKFKTDDCELVPDAGGGDPFYKIRHVIAEYK